MFRHPYCRILHILKQYHCLHLLLVSNVNHLLSHRIHLKFQMQSNVQNDRIRSNLCAIRFLYFRLIPVLPDLLLYCFRLKLLHFLQLFLSLLFPFLSLLFLLFLGLLDPTFQKIVFWCFYGIAAMLLMVGMDHGKPAGPLSALFERVSKLVTVPLGLLWRKKDR